jgi:hypothetical protein
MRTRLRSANAILIGAFICAAVLAACSPLASKGRRGTARIHSSNVEDDARASRLEKR